MTDPNVLTIEDLRAMQTELEKDYGFVFGSDDALKLHLLPLGIPSLDHALDGGFAFGRMVMLIGEWASGKTLLALLAIKAAQERGISCAYIDAERTWNPEWSRNLGVDVDDVLVQQPTSGEKAFDAAIDLCKRRVGVIVIDSLAEMAPSAELEADSIGDNLPASQARMINRGLRVLKNTNEHSLVLVINQLREKVGVLFGNPESLPGGKGQRFASWQIVRVRRGAWKTEGETRIGYDLKIVVEKNKQGAPWKEGSVPFFFSGEFDQLGSLISLAVDLGIIRKTGAKYEVPGIEGTIFGMPKLIEAVKTDPELAKRIEAEIQKVPEI